MVVDSACIGTPTDNPRLVSDDGRQVLGGRVTSGVIGANGVVDAGDRRPIGLKGVVVCSGGLHVAQRGHELPAGTAGLCVSDVSEVALPATSPVSARTIDGQVWRRHWIEPGRMVVDFVGLAIVEVDDRTGHVVFDRLLAEDMEQHLLFDHVLPLVLARKGRVVLHGALLSLDGEGVVLVGAGGAGKSTFTAFAWKRGWTVGGDDGAVVTVSPPAAEPTYPTIRLAPASAALLGLELVGASPVAGKLRIVEDTNRPFQRQAVRLRVIAILEPTDAGEPATFNLLDGMSAHARLFGSTFHAELSGTTLLGDVVDQLGTLVETTTVGTIAVPRGLEGLAAAEELLRSHVEA